MLRKFVSLAALTLAGAALFVPDASCPRRRGRRWVRRWLSRWRRLPGTGRDPSCTFMGRTGPAPRWGATDAPSGAPCRLRSRSSFPYTRPVRSARVGKPFAHLARRDFRHHRRNVGGYVYPFTWDDGSYAGSYIGVPYDPGAAIPVYAPAPLVAPVLDPPPSRPVPRIGMRDDGGEACRAERVTVPGDKGDREITVVRC